MFEISQMVKRIQGSERSQRKIMDKYKLGAIITLSNYEFFALTMGTKPGFHWDFFNNSYCYRYFYGCNSALDQMAAQSSYGITHHRRSREMNMDIGFSILFR